MTARTSRGAATLLACSAFFLAPAAAQCFEVDDGYESNDSCTEPFKLCEGLYEDLVVGKPSIGYTDDYWRIKVQPGATVTITAHFRHVDGDIDMRTLDRVTCATLGISQSVTDDETLTWTNTNGVTDSVLVRVYVWGGSIFDCNDYDLEISGSDPNCGGTAVCSPGVPNSTGQSGRMRTVSTRTAGDTIGFVADQLPPGQLAYFIAAANQGFVANPAGSMGNLCAVSDTARFNAQAGSVGASGIYNAALDTSMMQTTPVRSALSGETWVFQCWHRDSNPLPTSNFTDALSLTFL